MALTPIFHGHVRADGVLTYPDSERALRRTHLLGLRNKDVEVIVRKVRVRRSLDQNAYIHAKPIPILADHLGYTIPEAKLVLMGECWGYRFDQASGREIPIKPSTSDMDVEECTYFIDWVIPWAATKHGVIIPLPGEAA